MATWSLLFQVLWGNNAVPIAWRNERFARLCCAALCWGTSTVSAKYCPLAARSSGRKRVQGVSEVSGQDGIVKSGVVVGCFTF